MSRSLISALYIYSQYFIQYTQALLSKHSFAHSQPILNFHRISKIKFFTKQQQKNVAHIGFELHKPSNLF